jgi:hypothetical protein
MPAAVQWLLTEHSLLPGVQVAPFCFGSEHCRLPLGPAQTVDRAHS